VEESFGEGGSGLLKVEGSGGGDIVNGTSTLFSLPVGAGDGTSEG
jgi:hypothetical protein